MLKKLARKILKKELKSLDQVLQGLTKSEKRLSDLANTLNAENRALRRDERPNREYNFTPEKISAEEQKIFGKFVETPLIALLTKLFKSKADQNNDLLLHNSDKDPIKEAKFKLAVLMYDDWITFLKNCQKQYEKEN